MNLRPVPDHLSAGSRVRKECAGVCARAEFVTTRRRCSFGIEREEELAMEQHGQVFKLKTRGADGKPTWAYRYRADGRGSARPQVGGFGSQVEALHLLEKAHAVHKGFWD
jgi:hypothetical protein